MITPADLLAVLPDQPVILEAGAHHGEDTVVFAQHAAHVYAFEPVPFCSELAAWATDDLSNVTLSPLALGKAQTTAEMWVSVGVDDASSSLMKPTQHHIKYPHINFFQDTLDVKVTTIDAWCAHHGVDHIDGMWLDMQGGELAALQSAGKILDTVSAMMLETSLVELYDGCPLWPEVRDWLHEQNFNVITEYIYPGDYAGEVLVAR